MRRAYIQWIATLVLATTVTTTAFSYCPEPKSTSPAEPSAKLVLLGTAAGPIPRRTRSQPASAIQIGENVYLIDVNAGIKWGQPPV